MEVCLCVRVVTATIFHEIAPTSAPGGRRIDSTFHPFALYHTMHTLCYASNEQNKRFKRHESVCSTSRVDESLQFGQRMVVVYFIESQLAFYLCIGCNFACKFDSLLQKILRTSIFGYVQAPANCGIEKYDSHCSVSLDDRERQSFDGSNETWPSIQAEASILARTEEVKERNKSYIQTSLMIIISPCQPRL